MQQETQRRQQAGNFNPACKSFVLKGFTLVELFIVIVIIAILAGLLLPALNLAKKTAKMSACASNLKQLGLAFYSYANDIKECFPFASYDRPNTSGVLTKYTWGDMLAPDMNITSGITGVSASTTGDRTVPKLSIGVNGVRYIHNKLSFNMLLSDGHLESFKAPLMNRGGYYGLFSSCRVPIHKR